MKNCDRRHVPRFMYVQGRSCTQLSPLSVAFEKNSARMHASESHKVPFAHDGEAERSWITLADLPSRALFHSTFLLLFPFLSLSLSLSLLFRFLQNSKAAVICFLNVTMASIRLMGLINLLLLFNPAAAAMKHGYIGPTATSVGLVGIQRMAPRPTRPPSMEESTGELRKRRLPDSIYSLIPKAWCGFVDGDFGKSEAQSLFA